MQHLSKDFWSARYQNEMTGWDLGKVSPPLKTYIDQLEDKLIKILIPGCGNGYEAEYLWENGFKNVHVIDLAKEPLENLHSRVPEFPKEHMHQGNFFEHEGDYDLIMEQTMFCAIAPVLRQEYADKVYDLLKPEGKLVGVMFNCDFDGGPPYGGNSDEYKRYFSGFPSVSFTECYNSIDPRQGNEYFVKISK